MVQIQSPYRCSLFTWLKVLKGSMAPGGPAFPNQPWLDLLAQLLALQCCLTLLTPDLVPLRLQLALYLDGSVECWLWFSQHLHLLICVVALHVNLGFSSSTQMHFFVSGLPRPFSPPTLTSVVPLVLMVAPQTFCNAANRTLTTVCIWTHYK